MTGEKTPFKTIAVSLKTAPDISTAVLFLGGARPLSARGLIAPCRPEKPLVTLARAGFSPQSHAGEVTHYGFLIRALHASVPACGILIIMNRLIARDSWMMIHPRVPLSMHAPESDQRARIRLLYLCRDWAAFRGTLAQDPL